MLNRNFVVSMVQSCTVNNMIAEELFANLFAGLEEQEVEAVFDLLKELDITVGEADEDGIEESSDINSVFYCNGLEVKRLKKLTNEELCVLYQRGNRAALDALSEKNRRMIYKIAAQCFRDYRPETLEIEELVQAGNEGLTKAAQKFDVKKEFKFLTYACWWIRQAITREIMNVGFNLRLPVHVYDHLHLIRRCKNTYKPSSLEELQALLGAEGHEYSLKKLKELILIGEKYTHIISLNEMVGDESDSERIEFIPDSVNVEEEATQTMLRCEIDRIARRILQPKEWDIIQKRFGMNGYPQMTLEEIGKEYHVTRERIRQIENKAMRKFRYSRYAAPLSEYLCA